jgi:hypothetical protein
LLSSATPFPAKPVPHRVSALSAETANGAELQLQIDGAATIRPAALCSWSWFSWLLLQLLLLLFFSEEISFLKHVYRFPNSNLARAMKDDESCVKFLLRRNLQHIVALDPRVVFLRSAE